MAVGLNSSLGADPTRWYQDTEPVRLPTDAQRGIINTAASNPTPAIASTPSPLPSGLISSTQTTRATSTGYNPAQGTATQATSVGYDPTLASVNLPTDTVSGQLKTILEQDSPYITRARAGATETANARGLVNSSIAAGAGEAAAIDAALPIATADAGIFGQQRLANQQYGNTASQFGAAAANTASMFNTGEANSMSKFNAESTNAARIFGATASNTASMFNAGEANKAALQAQQGELARQLEAFKAAEARGLSAQEAQQQQALQAQKAEVDAQLQAQQAAQQQALLTRQAEIDREMQALQAKTAAELSAQEAAQLQELQAAKLAAEQEMAKLDAETRIGAAWISASTAGAGSDAAAAAAIQVATINGQTQRDVAALNIQGQQAMAAINGSNQGLIGSNAAAATLANGAVGQIAAITTNPDLTPDQRDAAISNVVAATNAGLRTVGTINNIDIPPLDITVAATPPNTTAAADATQA